MTPTSTHPPADDPAEPQVLYAVADQVATVTLNRPAKLNAWTWDMTREVRDAMLRAQADDAVRVIVLTGAGRGFCAGADMGLLSALSSGQGAGAPRLEPFDPDGDVNFFGTNSYFPAIRKPVIGAINGVATGLGFVYALFCDVRIASSDAYFQAPFARRGAIAEHGVAWLLPRVVGIGHAMDILLSSRKVDAADALRIGLVTRVVPPGELMAAAGAYAAVLAQESSPRALAVIKRQVWASLSNALGEDVAISLAEIAKARASEDFREGVAHFVEKRKPRFTGR